MRRWIARRIAGWLYDDDELAMLLRSLPDILNGRAGKGWTYLNPGDQLSTKSASFGRVTSHFSRLKGLYGSGIADDAPIPRGFIEHVQQEAWIIAFDRAWRYRLVLEQPR